MMADAHHGFRPGSNKRSRPSSGSFGGGGAATGCDARGAGELVPNVVLNGACCVDGGIGLAGIVRALVASVAADEDGAVLATVLGMPLGVGALALIVAMVAAVDELSAAAGALVPLGANANQPATTMTAAAAGSARTSVRGTRFRGTTSTSPTTLRAVPASLVDGAIAAIVATIGGLGVAAPASSRCSAGTSC